MKVDMTNRKVTTDGKLPQTGEKSYLHLYVAGTIVSLGAILLLLKRRKTAKKLNQE